MTRVVPLSTAEFRCVTCGYGISMSGALPVCPMCRQSVWEITRDRGAISEPSVR